MDKKIKRILKGKKRSPSKLGNQESDGVSTSQGNAEKSVGACHDISKTTLVYEEEPHQRLYVTKRDPKPLRTLKSLHLVPGTPKAITFAQVGTQAHLPDTSLSRDIELLLASVQRLQEELDLANSKLQSSENSTSEFEAEHLDFEKQLVKAATEIVEKDDLIADLKKDNEKILEKNTEFKEHIEKLDNELAFAQDEKDYAEKHTAAYQESAGKLQQELTRTKSELHEYQNLYTQTKVKSSEVLGHYLDELNTATEDLRALTSRKASGQSDHLQKLISRADDYLRLKEENYRLVEQKNILEAQVAAQEVHTEQVQEQVAELGKVVRAYQETGATPSFNADSSVLVESFTRDRITYRSMEESLAALLGAKLNKARSNRKSPRKTRTKEGAARCLCKDCHLPITPKSNKKNVSESAVTEGKYNTIPRTARSAQRMLDLNG